MPGLHTLILFFSLLFLLNAGASAGSCKGLSKSKCQDRSSCTWEKGFSTKKGDVDSFCRKKHEKSYKEDNYKGMNAFDRHQQKQKDELMKQGRELPADY